MDSAFDVVVVGGGHAGLEAAAAAARLGATTALVSLDPDALGRMSCNPAVGGIGKGQLAREVDALDGLMGRAADASAIQFRLLNTRKGLAVQSPRTQNDRARYEVAARALLAEQGGVRVVAGEVVDLRFHGEGAARRLAAVVLADGRELAARAAVLTTGTFLEGVLHTGRDRREGGRVGERGAAQLGDALRRLGLPTARLKTGTPPRLAADSVDRSAMEEQPGDAAPVGFSFLAEAAPREQVSCWLTRTTPRTHELVRAHLHEAPMYAGRIQGRGPRYCPSIEDKVVRFAEKESHTLFLEPEGWDSPLLYVNGLSTSLPAAVQDEVVRSCVGMERARIVQPGYAVEYTHVAPRALRRTLELREHPGLFLAGQICGTSGYEEAAAQGLLAGVNAALRARGDEPDFVPARDEAYLGVLVDDLVVCDPSEPYRMFTSRAEHRLLLRHDDADLRLTPRAMALGLARPERVRAFTARRERLDRARRLLAATPDPRDDGSRGRRRTLWDVLGAPRRGDAAHPTHPTHGWEAVLALHPEAAGWGLTRGDRATLLAEATYRGYAERQRRWVERGGERERTEVPEGFDYGAVRGLRAEAREALSAARPATLGAAGRLAGVTPADVALLEVALRRAGVRPTPLRAASR